jgi:MFS family permease
MDLAPSASALAGSLHVPGWRPRSVLVTASVSLAVAVMALMQTISIPLLPALPEPFDTDITSVSWQADAAPLLSRSGGPRLGARGAGRVAARGDRRPGRAGHRLGRIPVAYGIVRDELPPRHLSRAVSVVTAASAGLGAGLGPVIMGGVLSAHGWRAVFWLTGALCLLALVLVLASTRGASTRFPARFDLPGAVVLAAALTVLLLGITNGAGWGLDLAANRGARGRRRRDGGVVGALGAIPPRAARRPGRQHEPPGAHRPPRRGDGGLRHVRAVHLLVHAGLAAGRTRARPQPGRRRPRAGALSLVCNSS